MTFFWAALACATVSFAADHPKAKPLPPSQQPPAADPTPRGNGVDPDSDGCGVGWQVTKRRTFLGTSTRGTTNAVIPPTFGMTSGTMGCVQHPFAATMRDDLELELAMGIEGEATSAFAALLGCADGASFARVARKNYKALVAPDGGSQGFLDRARKLGCGNG